MRGWLFDSGSHSRTTSVGLLVVRVSAGLMMAAGHGWGKLVSFGQQAATFPDPLGIGHRLAMAGAIGAEFFCSVLVALGLATRVASIPVVFTMGVAAFMIHANDPWGKKEMALLYLVLFLVFAFTGAGSYSLDARLGGRKRR